MPILPVMSFTNESFCVTLGGFKAWLLPTPIGVKGMCAYVSCVHKEPIEKMKARLCFEAY
jgi:hypothetical protein